MSKINYHVCMREDFCMKEEKMCHIVDKMAVKAQNNMDVSKEIQDGLIILAERSSDANAKDRKNLICDHLKETPSNIPLVFVDQSIRVLDILSENATEKDANSVLELMDGINLLGDALDYYEEPKVKYFPELDASETECTAFSDTNRFLDIQKKYIKRILHKMKEVYKETDITSLYHIQRYFMNPMMALDIIFCEITKTGTFAKERKHICRSKN